MNYHFSGLKSSFYDSTRPAHFEPNAARLRSPSGDSDLLDTPARVAVSNAIVGRFSRLRIKLSEII
jgi:hypothetical protein